MEKQILLENITKRYQKQILYDQINLTIDRGDSIAFVGHNGCGKSTLLKLIAGLISPDSGKLSYHSRTLDFQYVPEAFPKVNMTARRFLQFSGKISGIKNQLLKQLIGDLSQDFFLEDLLDIPLQHLSKGSLQKIAVIQALLKPADILLLDEPISGQDLASQKVLIEKLRFLNQNGTTLIMSCHEEFLIEALSQKVFRIDQGKLIFEKNTVTTDSKSRLFYQMVFETKNYLEIPQSLQHLLTKQESDKVWLIAQSDKTNETIQMMIKMGWILREMYVAEND